MTTEKIQREQGNISVNTENIFPIIKRSLYSDHEIFLRELISNALDATQKLKYLASTGAFQGELGDLAIKVTVDAEAKTITISDFGIGMTDEEVRQYINQVAFSGAEEFVKKFKDAGESNEIIGRFGLGFYSAFMVSTEVEIITQSYQENAASVRWTCDGSTSYTLEESERERRGSDIVLHIDADSEEFLDNYRIKNILTKYFRFVSNPIEMDGELINPTPPLWKKSPTEITDEEYKSFFQELYPMAEDPLFWIHLNIDHPFNLTGILYFPKIKKDIDPNRNKIQLFCRQVFITEEVKDIVPEYLMLLQGVIDSPDIPLNVSRSYLQSDSNVKKISGYITRKVADKLNEIFNEDREKYEEKWPDISIFVKYGML
ncbi:MAG: molecular chaperone HtpG, partial [Bacteroidia bacterium]